MGALLLLRFYVGMFVLGVWAMVIWWWILIPTISIAILALLIFRRRT